jgi:arylsulfatase A-like enzyme
MIRWPQGIPAGSRCDYPGLVFDLFPTFLDLAGAPRPVGLDAVSLLPALRGQPMPASRELYFVRREGGPAYGGKSYEALIRDGWKLMQNDPYSPLELYNLAEDPYERQDLAATRPEVLDEMKAALRKHVQRGGAVPWQPHGKER